MLEDKTLKNITHLARIEMNEAELQEAQVQLTKVLAYFDQIKNIKTENIEPLVTPTEILAQYREDQVIQEFSVNELLENAPNKVGNLFKVPPVI